MKVAPLSSCERNFLLQSFLENFRVDCRSCDQFRELKIVFGLQDGSCLACIGNTKVFTQVSSELVEPKSSRPNEGLIFVNVEMSPMAAPNFEVGRLGDRGVELCRLLERLIKESGCVDTESLCIKANEKAWQIRLDVHVLDHDGSLIDCASVSAIAALAHFRRPDVSVSGEEIIIHSPEEKDPVALNLYHYPVCVTFGFTENGQCCIVDPSEKEEQVLEGTVVVGANKRQEICTLHCSGGMIVKKEQILKCANRGLIRAGDIVEIIKTKLVALKENRSQGNAEGFSDIINTLPLTGYRRESKIVPFSDTSTSVTDRPSTSRSIPSWPIKRTTDAVHLGEGSSKLMTERMDESDDDDIEIIKEITNAVKHKLMPTADMQQSKDVKPKSKDRKRTAEQQWTPNDDQVADLLGDIEDDVMILEPQSLGYEKKRPKSPEYNDKIDLTTALKAKTGRKRKQKSKTEK